MFREGDFGVLHKPNLMLFGFCQKFGVTGDMEVKTRLKFNTLLNIFAYEYEGKPNE